MHRRGVVLLVAAVVATLTAPATASAQPDIVLIVTDDQRWDTLAYMPTVQSELVGRGVTFTNGFVVNPLCCPSRAATLTGQYSHSTGVYKNGDLGMFWDNESSTIATWLQEAGYRTALIGKYMNRYDATYIPPGWDRWVAFWAPGDYFNYTLVVGSSGGPGVLRTHGDLEHDYSTDVLAKEAASFIRTTPRAQPLFLMFTPVAPHSPATPAPRHESFFADLDPWRPPSFNEWDVSDKPRWLRAKRRLTASEIAVLDALRINQLRTLLAVDDAVGGILGALAATGRLTDTLIVFTSDNGLLWGEHGLTSKRFPYEESIRVPFVVRHGALPGVPRTDERLVTNIDIAPTFAAAAGVAAPGAEGLDLGRLLTSTATSWRPSFLVESLEHRVFCEARATRFSYTLYPTGEEELYDLARDPYQLWNRARDPNLRRELSSLRERLLTLCQPPPPSYPPLVLKSPCLILGSSGADVLVGTSYFDFICGGRGDDVIYARRTGDRADGGAGADTVYGQGGRDTVVGGMGRDRLFGGAANDRFVSRDGVPDRVSCGDGDDAVEADALDRIDDDCEHVRRG